MNLDYQPERLIPSKPTLSLVTHHRVTVDHLFPSLTRYAGRGLIPSSLGHVGTYYYYVASRQQNGTLAASPGPNDVTKKATPFLTLTTAPSDPDAPRNYDAWPIGAIHVYQGHDL